ncbi:MAG: HAD-IB family phosphatase [Sandarakinorhabdus sp.]|nr:HAD-IB family phosphatase [Sandarakinorhabdus sp.]
MTISIYDMDRTITRRGTWLPWLTFWLRTEAPCRVLLVPLMLGPGIAYWLKLIDRGRLKALGQQLVMGRSVARHRVERVAAAFAHHIIADDVFPDAITAFETARATGHVLVMATASNAYYVKAIADQLGFDAVIATESRWVEDALLARLDGDNSYGEAKRIRIAAWLERHDDPGAAFDFYSDHLSDLPSFELAEERGGVAVAVNPSPALRAEATRRGWAIVDWGMTEKSFFERA